MKIGAFFVCGNTMVTAYLATAAQNADEAIKANIQTYATSDYKLSNPITEITNAANIQPNNGKNVDRNSSKSNC